MSHQEVTAIVGEAEKLGEVLGIRIPVTDERDDAPWTAPPSRQRKEPPIIGPLPEQIDLVFGNQIYVPKADITPSLRNRVIRLAAFQNPEFYRAQAMRLSTFGKPRIICCCEDFPQHLGLPRGCLDELLDLFQSLKIKVKLTDERFTGTSIELQFQGDLRTDQQQAATALLERVAKFGAGGSFGGKLRVFAPPIMRRTGGYVKCKRSRVPVNERRDRFLLA